MKKNWLSSAEIRRRFIDYFASRDHQVVPSSSLVPANDPTLLFTNAGMVQFKDVFLGAERRPYTRAVSAQRCVRAGGKHNDLDQVGYTARHHTFFEMLGNFSFGDYFKAEAIRYAWDFLTVSMRLPAERLWITVYHDDDEAYELWVGDIGVAASRVTRIGDVAGGEKYQSDNFWAMGEAGPCGPCTEIFYDHGPEIAGGSPGTAGADGDRYVEIWNLVFMQFDRAPSGEMRPLPKPCVDTGMGLERLAAVAQGVHSNYDIDLFRALIAAAGRLTGTGDAASPSLKVIADHIRSAAFLLADGVLPANDGRGYVLRRIIRRAARHGYQLGVREPFFWRMAEPLAAEMGEAYPELNAAAERIETTLRAEEERFGETLAQGMVLFEQAVAGLAAKVVPGELIFRLYDTYGFPPDLTADLARERGLSADLDGFTAEMEQQRARGRAASRFGPGATISAEAAKDLPPTEFLGYEQLKTDEARLLAILVDGETVAALEAGQAAALVLDRTPFYAESGGQVGDSGTLGAGDTVFEVSDTVKIGGQFYGHLGTLCAGRLAPGMTLAAAVDRERRADIARHHSATHLLHAALRRVLGPHVEQKGSLVAADRLRFDFSHPKPLTAGELRDIERLVNAEIRANAKAEIRYSSFDEAVASGAVALFGEKYGDTVRVMRFGDFSAELCGGTHVRRVGDIGQFKIVAESGVAAGIRRLEAVAGRHAEAWIAGLEARLAELASMLKTSPAGLPERVGQLAEQNALLQQEVAALRREQAGWAVESLAAGARRIGDVAVISSRFISADPAAMRQAVDRCKQALGAGVIVLGASDQGKARLVVGVTRPLAGRLKAGELAAELAVLVEGRGGGRDDLAQAGGPAGDRLDEALAAVLPWVESRLVGRG